MLAAKWTKSLVAGANRGIGVLQALKALHRLLQFASMKLPPESRRLTHESATRSIYQLKKEYCILIIKHQYAT
jgi:hypothetical protein